MYGHYVAAVIKRAFQPTARFTDIMQILAASAAPAVAKFLGLPVPSPEDTLAYIGAAALAFVALRVLFVAPYQVWRQNIGVIAGLRTELTKPERLELQHIAKIRAKARIKMATAIRRLQHQYFLGEGRGMIAEKLEHEIVRLHAQVSPSPVFTATYSAFTNELMKVIDIEVPDGDGMEEALKHTRALTMAYKLGEWLQGRITDEALLSLLRQDTEPETQP